MLLRDGNSLERKKRGRTWDNLVEYGGRLVNFWNRKEEIAVEWTQCGHQGHCPCPRKSLASARHHSASLIYGHQ